MGPGCAPTYCSVSFGCLVPPIADQLQAQGLCPVRKADGEKWQKSADAVCHLKMHSLISPAACESARRKLLKTICRAVEKIPQNVLAHPLGGAAGNIIEAKEGSSHE